MLKLNIYVFEWCRKHECLAGSTFAQYATQGLASDHRTAHDQAAVLTWNAVQEFKPGWLLSRLGCCSFSPSRLLGDFLRSFLSKWLPQSFLLQSRSLFFWIRLAKGDKSKPRKESLWIRVFWNAGRRLIDWKNLLLYFLLCLFQRPGDNSKYFHSLIPVLGVWGPLCLLTREILRAPLRGRCCYHLHFSGKVIVAQKGIAACWSSQGQRVAGLGSEPRQLGSRVWAFNSHTYSLTDLVGSPFKALFS